MESLSEFGLWYHSIKSQLSRARRTKVLTAAASWMSSPGVSWAAGAPSCSACWSPPPPPPSLWYPSHSRAGWSSADHTPFPSIKGTVSLDGYFYWRPKHFNQYFLCMRWWFSRSFKSFTLLYTMINFLFATLKLLPNFKNAFWNPPQNFLLCDWSIFSSADLSLAAGKMREN